jgi:cystathionine beta-lyase/cystathionine gamma-synthase
MRLDTKLVHAGELSPRPAGAVSTPIFQSSTFEHAGTTSYHDVRYIRLNNTPNHAVLHARIAAMESAPRALVAASGMAAITASMLALLESGDHVLAHDTLYGGTHDLLTKDLPRLGIDHAFVDASRPETWKAALRPKTKIFYVEAMTNPLLQVVALEEVVAFARANDLVTIIDNTFATPVAFRPFEHGFDLVIHSATKYLNGHSDIVAGVVAGRADLVELAKHKLDHFGGSLDPHACFLLGRGMKTLSVRFRHQSTSALELARFLAGHTSVARVNHPGLETHPDHARAKKLFGDLYGGMLSFELSGGVGAAEALFERLTIPISAPSLGGPETLVTRPATTSHAGLDPATRKKLGITDGLVRVSVGLEAIEDLVEDFARALG